MLAKLVSNSAVSQTNSNARILDIAKLWSGAITSTSGLNATVWDVAQCYVKNTTVANWSVLYQNAGTNLDNAGSSATWKLFMSKQGTDTPTKTVQVSIESTALASIYMSAGSFDSIGTSSASSPATPAASSNLAFQLNVPNNTFVVGSAASSLYLYSTFDNCIHFCVEKPASVYDSSTTEALGLVGFISSANAINGGYIYNILNLTTRTYVPVGLLGTHFNCNWQTDTIGMSRAADKSLVSPMIPLYVEGYSIGWVGGNVSTKSGIYRLADMAGSFWDTISNSGVTYRVIPVGNLRYSFPDA